MWQHIKDIFAAKQPGSTEELIETIEHMSGPLKYHASTVKILPRAYQDVSN